jgi:hypothetical protein
MAVSQRYALQLKLSCVETETQILRRLKNAVYYPTVMIIWECLFRTREYASVALHPKSVFNPVV